MNNEFILIRSYPKYEINKEGQIRNTKTRKILKPYLSKSGYYSITFRTNMGYVTMRLHRLLALVFIPNPDNLYTVNGIKTDNRLENLEWLSLSDNISHAHKNRLINVVGTRNHKAKLTEEEVLEIRDMSDKGIPNKELSKKFNVSPCHISCIINRKGWKHVK